jgi:hypothetical protein
MCVASLAEVDSRPVWRTIPALQTKTTGGPGWSPPAALFMVIGIPTMLARQARR